MNVREGLRRLGLLLGVVGFAGGMSGIAGEPTSKKRVAVFDFENAATQSVSSPLLQFNPAKLGKAAADLLIVRLVQDGVVSVVERSAIDKLLAEQNLSNSDRSDPATAARIGRVLGVDGIITGTITQHDYEDKMTSSGNRILRQRSDVTKHDIKGRVQITARLVSPDTAEVLAVSQGVGEVIQKGVKVNLYDMNPAVAMGGVGSPVMNEAMSKAVVQLAGELDQLFPKLPQRTRVIEGLVADAEETGRLVLNVGSLHGVKQGDRLQVWRMGKEIRDPANGKLLMRDDRLLGEAVVNTVKENVSIAAYSGAEKVKTGDLVKSPPTPATTAPR